MSTGKNHTQPTTMFICNFCGNQLASADRCAGCGASSQQPYDRTIKSSPAEALTQTKKFRFSNYPIHFVLAVIAGLLVTYYTSANRNQPAVSTNTSLAETTRQTALFDHDRLYNEREVRSKLAGHDDFVFSYVGINHSDRSDNRVELILQATQDNTVLVLSSYKAVVWNIKNPHKISIAAIVFGAGSAGSRVIGDLSPNTVLIPTQNRIGNLTNPRTCTCNTSGYFDCAGTLANDTIIEVERLGAALLTGVSNQQSASTIHVPHSTTKRYLKREQQQQAIQEKNKALCLSQN